jgi:hypothetical protein
VITLNALLITNKFYKKEKLLKIEKNLAKQKFHKKAYKGFQVSGTNRDGKSRCPFVLGQKSFLVPVSLCPWTRARANVPGQTPLSRDVPGQNHFNKRTQKTEKGRSKTGK